MDWFWTDPLGITITGTIIAGIALTIITGLPRRIQRWGRGRASDRSESRETSEKDLHRRLLDRLTENVTAIEAVWRARSAPVLRVKADGMSMEVEAMAYQLRDAEARRLVLKWKAAYDSAPHGEGQGATDQATVMRDAYRAAARRLGELIRGEK